MNQATRSSICFAAAALLALLGPACSLGSISLGTETGGSANAGASIADPIAAGTTIAALSNTEAEAWCTWMLDTVFKAPTAVDAPVGSDGTVSGYPDYGCLQPTPGLCLLDLSVHHCAANLQLFPCAATVGDVDACVLGMSSHEICDAPGTACEKFRAQPSCDKTLLGVPAVQPQGQCSVQVQ